MKDSVLTSLRPQTSPRKSLTDLVAEFSLEVRGSLENLCITGLSLSSADVLPGDMYIGLAGNNVHGATFAREAKNRGAVAVLTDFVGGQLCSDLGLPLLLQQQPREILGAISAWLYQTNEHSLTLFGVTGTNGKTSVSYLLDALLAQLGAVVGLSTTAERRIAGRSAISALTTPEAPEMHAFLARMLEEGVCSAVIEVSAQALSRHRVDGIMFDVVGFTNLSHDHLDDYSSMEDYFDAKKELFQPARARKAVVVVDSDWGRRLAEHSLIPVVTLSSDASCAADWHFALTHESLEETRCELRDLTDHSLTISVPVMGKHMAENAALAVVMLVESGVSFQAIAEVLHRDGGIKVFIPGRAERIESSGPIVYLDYGHSPDAFKTTLTSLRRIVNGKIVMVFGADGDRDPTKRAEMGALAAQLADLVVITDFHPRSEDPALIRGSLIEGARSAVPEREIYDVADPRAAFRVALSHAKPGDVVLYAGPGHENYHEVAGKKIPYSARDDVKLALAEHGWA